MPWGVRCPDNHAAGMGEMVGEGVCIAGVEQARKRAWGRGPGLGQWRVQGHEI